MTLYARDGARKYVNRVERERFLRAAEAADPNTRTLCMTLAYTGCRISEAFALVAPNDIHQDAGVVSIRTLKKRRANVVREVPVPIELVSALDAVHDIGGSLGTGTNSVPLWPLGRTTAWERVKGVMVVARIAGPHATPRGLRHGFGVHAIQTGVPLNLVQKWLGHASLSTTAIYANAVGPEEQAIAARMW